jgi:hypothetical protein
VSIVVIVGDNESVSKTEGDVNVAVAVGVLMVVRQGDRVCISVIDVECEVVSVIEGDAEDVCDGVNVEVFVKKGEVNV